MKSILDKIVQNDLLHGKWLNTLSFMENAGARKISACEDITKTGIMQLKHAAEEHRHAYYLKKQLAKLGQHNFEFYDPQSMLGGSASMQYLHRLDVLSCRYLKTHFGLSGGALRYAAYLFVTYAIEMRADVLYPIYQELLTKWDAKVSVKSIILEEEGHLQEMITALKQFSADWETHSEKIITLEKDLYVQWEKAIEKQLASDEAHTPAVN
ncbi:hypothetical protein [Sphingobacterium sp. JB170]|uniref:hypothetical protein n=1 Tax=Sphingobacterium sp. JB170 TaxID=1434842 RepID=UPI00097F4A1B|nr:hypothetical protein [Sphingobacterium sp. JB170]SJN47635.1 hypothetical protein FM107_15915 [Sphingobacterium sp. JB170]